MIHREVSIFGPLCLSSDSARCPLSKSLMDFKIRRAVRPYFKLPPGTLYFRHYEVGRAVSVCGCMAACPPRVPCAAATPSARAAAAPRRRLAAPQRTAQSCAPTSPRQAPTRSLSRPAPRTARAEARPAGTAAAAEPPSLPPPSGPSAGTLQWPCVP